jgi:hypothetical protein
LTPPLCLPKPVTTLTSLLHIYHPLSSLLYQPYTPPALCNPWHKHPTTTVELHPNTHKGPKTHQPPCLFAYPCHLPFPPALLLLAPPLPIIQFSSSTQTTITSSNSHCL